MRLKQELITILKKSFSLTMKAPLLWIFFYIFVILSLLIDNYLPSGVSKLSSFFLVFLTLGLPALKVEFLDNIDQDKKVQFKQTIPLLIKYFKKLLFVTVFLFILGIIFSFISSLTIYILVDLIKVVSKPSTIELIQMITFLPLAVIYFSLFHLFIVVLVKAKKNVFESLIISLTFIKKNLKIVSLIILFSLIIHYPVSDLLMFIVNKLFFAIDSIWITAVLAFFNVIIDLFFFATWLVLYKKKS